MSNNLIQNLTLRLNQMQDRTNEAAREAFKMIYNEIEDVLSNPDNFDTPVYTRDKLNRHFVAILTPLFVVQHVEHTVSPKRDLGFILELVDSFYVNNAGNKFAREIEPYSLLKKESKEYIKKLDRFYTHFYSHIFESESELIEICSILNPDFERSNRLGAAA